VPGCIGRRGTSWLVPSPPPRLITVKLGDALPPLRTRQIGRYDRNPQIYREGWRALRDAGVRLHDFESELRTEIDAINQEFIEHFVAGTGPSGGAKFDYQLNVGRFEIQFS
jgi:diaminohydroxyphosphoribosylaminopyrimidine deaminase/5-amino-6-(5-phosphoribosylamino)uracil reductase